MALGNSYHTIEEYQINLNVLSEHIYSKKEIKN